MWVSQEEEPEGPRTSRSPRNLETEVTGVVVMMAIGVVVTGVAAVVYCPFERQMWKASASPVQDRHLQEQLMFLLVVQTRLTPIHSVKPNG